MTAEFDADNHHAAAVSGLGEPDIDGSHDLLDDPVSAVTAAAMISHLSVVADQRSSFVAGSIVGNDAMLPRPGGPELVGFCSAACFWEPMAGPVLNEMNGHVPLEAAVQVLAGIENRVRAAIAAAVVDCIRRHGRCPDHDELADAVRNAGGIPLMAEVAGLIAGARTRG